MLWDGPGVGKTRLAMEIAEYASGLGFRCSVGRCYERDEPFPYLPFAEIIEGSLARAASLDEYRWRIGDKAAQLAQIVPRLRLPAAGFFLDGWGRLRRFRVTKTAMTNVALRELPYLPIKDTESGSRKISGTAASRCPNAKALLDGPCTTRAS
jgi:hypothetical protein